jgi:hypothetical protein
MSRKGTSPRNPATLAEQPPCPAAAAWVTRLRAEADRFAAGPSYATIDAQCAGEALLLYSAALAEARQFPDLLPALEETRSARHAWYDAARDGSEPLGPARRLAAAVDALSALILAEGFASPAGTKTDDAPVAGAGSLRDRAPEAPPPPRISVDLARKTITLDGTRYDVPSDNALRWVKVLAAHPGEWISSTELKKYDPELQSVRTDRWHRFLPPAILSLINSDTGKGSRIRCGAATP